VADLKVAKSAMAYPVFVGLSRAWIGVKLVDWRAAPHGVVDIKLRAAKAIPCVRREVIKLSSTKVA